MRLLLVLLFLSLCPISYAQDEEETAPTDEASADQQSAEEGSEPTENEAEESNSKPSAPPVVRHTPQPNKWRVTDVSRYLENYARRSEVQTFNEASLAVSGLYLPENTGKPQGGVLILHDNEQHAHWPQTVAPLREYLPDYGWNTLSLFMDQSVKQTLPPIPRRVQPAPANKDAATESEGEAPAETDQTEEQMPEVTEDELADETGEPDEIIDDTNDPDAPPSDELDAIAEEMGDIPDLAQKAVEQEEEAEEPKQDSGEAFMQLSVDRVRAGVRQLNSLGQFNLVIIAHGSNANWAAAVLNEVYQSNPDAKGFALILVDALASEFPTYPLNTMLANLDVAMLDLVTSNDPLDIKRAIDRRNTMRRNQRENYIQIRIPAVRTPLRGKHNGLTRRVRGWLQTNAAGEEVSIN